MKTIQSNYYEKQFDLTTDEAETLIDVYLEIAEELGFEPDVDDPEVLMMDSSSFDTVMYHVENFGQSKAGFDSIEHLFAE